MRLWLSFVLAALVAAPSAAQETAPPPDVPGLPVVADSERPPARRAHRPPPPCEAPTARFEVAYTGFPSTARAAFQAAVDTWACRIETRQTIRIDARWEDLDPATLGSAGPFLHRNFDGAPVRDLWFPAALADLYAGRDLAPNRADIEATFNATFGSWDLNPASPPLAGEYDLYTVVLHEIGHGLGLIGGLTVEDDRGQIGPPDGPDGAYIYDRYTVDDTGQPLLDDDRYPDGSVALGQALRSDMSFDGPAVRGVAGAGVPLYAPPNWETGGSYSHLDEDAFPEGEPDGLMTPFIRPQETIAEPGTVTCAMLADLGWLLAGDCLARVGRGPTTGLLVLRDGPNPFRDQTAFRVVGGQTLRADLFDARGRHLGALPVTEAAGERRVTVRGRALPGGLYLVRITDGEARTALPVVRAR